LSSSTHYYINDMERRVELAQFTHVINLENKILQKSLFHHKMVFCCA